MSQKNDLQKLAFHGVRDGVKQFSWDLKKGTLTPFLSRLANKSLNVSRTTQLTTKPKKRLIEVRIRHSRKIRRREGASQLVFLVFILNVKTRAPAGSSVMKYLVPQGSRQFPAICSKRPSRTSPSSTPPEHRAPRKMPPKTWRKRRTPGLQHETKTNPGGAEKGGGTPGVMA